MKMWMALLLLISPMCANAQLYRLVLNSTDFSVVASGSQSNATIATNVVSSARYLTMGTGKLLGRSTASYGLIEQISVGSGLSLSSGTLSSTASGAPSGTVVNTGTPSADNADIARYTDTTGTNVSPTIVTNGLTIQGGKLYVTNVQPSQIIGQMWQSTAMPLLPGSILTNITVTNILSGDVDIYTIPSGYVGIVPTLLLYNTTNATVTYYPEAKISGSYYRLANDSTITTTNLTVSSVLPYSFNAGETVSINLSLTGTTIRTSLVLYPTSSGLKGVLLTSYATGTNTWYTAPSNKRALLTNGSGGINAGATLAYNNSGVTVVNDLYVVDSGDVASELNKVGHGSVSSSSTTIGRIGSNIGPIVVNPSGTLVFSLTSSGATQYFLCSVIEF